MILCPLCRAKALMAGACPQARWSVASSPRRSLEICIALPFHLSRGASCVVESRRSLPDSPSCLQVMWNRALRHGTVTSAGGSSGPLGKGRIDIKPRQPGMEAGIRDSPARYQRRQQQEPQREQKRQQQQQDIYNQQQPRSQFQEISGQIGRRGVAATAGLPPSNVRTVSGQQRRSESSDMSLQGKPSARGDDLSRLRDTDNGVGDKTMSSVTRGIHSSSSRRTSDHAHSSPYPNNSRVPGVDLKTDGDFGSLDASSGGGLESGGGTDNPFRSAGDERHQRMIREAIEGALRTDGKLTGEAIVRTPYKPGGGGGKVVGKVTFLVSPIEVAKEVLDQAQRDAEELSRRTVHPALVQAQGRRFQSIDLLGLATGYGGEGSSTGGGLRGLADAGGQAHGSQADREGRTGEGRNRGGKFLHDFREDDEVPRQEGTASATRASSAGRQYRFIVVKDPQVANHFEDAADEVQPPPVQSRQQLGSPASSLSQQQPKQAQQTQQQPLQLSGHQITSKSATRQGVSLQTQRDSKGASEGELQRQSPTVATSHGNLQQQQQQQNEVRQPRRGPQRGFETGQEEEEAEAPEGNSRRQRYDYRLRLDPRKSVGAMAGALAQALSRHLVVLSEVVGPDDLYFAMKVVATARTFLKQERETRAAASAPGVVAVGALGGGGGKPAAGTKQQWGQENSTTTLIQDRPQAADDLALQVLLPKVPYIRPREKGRAYDSGNGDETPDQRVWRLYSHRIPAPGPGVSLVEAPVRLYVSRSSDARELAEKVGLAVVRDGQVVVQAAGRDAVALALAAIVRIRSWLASRAKIGHVSNKTPLRANRDETVHPAAAMSDTADAGASGAVLPFLAPCSDDLDVAVYPAWCGAEATLEEAGGDPGEGSGRANGCTAGANGFRSLQLLVRLCQGSRPDLPVLGTDELLPPIA